jgi:glycosyltransferase involved in cell wall biosynthesis
MAGNQADVVPWLRALDVFALPSYANEGVPQALMQAMAVGIPVVTTAVGAIGELVQDERTGIMVAPRNSAALRTGLSRLLGDAALRARLAAAALAHVRAHCSEQRMLDDMERVFRAVAPRGGDPA